jgi:hypothetical protein
MRLLRPSVLIPPAKGCQHGVMLGLAVSGHVTTSVLGAEEMQLLIDGIMESLDAVQDFPWVVVHDDGSIHLIATPDSQSQNQRKN